MSLRGYRLGCVARWAVLVMGLALIGNGLSAQVTPNYGVPDTSYRPPTRPVKKAKPLKPAPPKPSTSAADSIQQHFESLRVLARARRDSVRQARVAADSLARANAFAAQRAGRATRSDSAVLRAPSGVSDRQLLIGVALSLSAYQGDFTAASGLKSPGAGGHFSLQLDSRKRIVPQLAAGVGQFQAGDLFLPPVSGGTANTFVRTDFWYVQLGILARPLRRPVPIGPFELRPHLSFGVGLLNFTPKDAAAAPLIEQSATRARGETYSSGTFMLPVGLGAQLRTWRGWGLTLDYSYVFTGSAYLDNVNLLGRGTGNDALHRFTFGIQIPVGL